MGSTARAQSETVVTHLRFRLRSIFDLPLSEGAVDRNPDSTLYTPKHCKPGGKKRVVTPEDLDAMTQTLDFREQIILRLATFEGMRPGEILGLHRGNVDFSEECLWVRRRVYKTNVDWPKSTLSKSTLSTRGAFC
jgi:integrase